MTQDPRLMTRRELRLAAAREATSATTVPDGATCAPAATPVLPTPTRPMSRRELRLAAAGHTPGAGDVLLPTQAAAPAACVAPFAVVVQTTEDALPQPARTDAVPSGTSYHASADSALPSRRPRPADTTSRVLTASRAAKAGTVLALSAGLVTSAVALQVENAPATRPGTTAPSLADLAALQQVRVATATSERLTAQAAHYATLERGDALAAAEAALADAETVATSAAAVVDPEVVAVLDQAIAELEAMVASSAVPAPPVPPAPVRAQALPAIDEEPATAAADEPGDLAPSSEVDDSPAQATARTVDPASRAATTRTPVGERAAAAEATAPEPAVVAPAGEAVGAGQPATAGDQAPADAALGALSLEITTQVRQTAERVAALSAEVQAAADAKVAEAEAQAAAAAAAEAAEAAAAAERARKVAAAAKAPNGQIPLDLLCAPAFAPDELLRCDAAEALEKLNAAYRADFGRDLEVVSSYRSYSAQVSVRRARGSYLAAAPGTSNHGLALAVDFGRFGGLGQFSSPNYKWMRANGPAYGWEHPRIMRPGGGGPQEPWHFEFGTS